MAIRKLFGTPTVDAGIFWSEVVNQSGWRVQYNRTLDAFSLLKPYRLLDPDGYLWASADSAQELAQAMPELIQEFCEKNPLFPREDVAPTLMTVATLLLRGAVASKGIAATTPKQLP
jgi:hypothetical protein